MRVPAKLLPLMLGLLCTVSLSASPLHWTPASFRGLVVGRSREADVIRLLGRPDGQFYTPATTSMSYKGRGDHQGELSVFLDRSGVIVEIQESFPVAIPRSRIYKELGRDAVMAHYSFDRCKTLYRDPNGSIELTLYPARGMYLWPDQYGYDFAAVHYAARPPGVDHPPPCGSRK